MDDLGMDLDSDIEMEMAAMEATRSSLLERLRDLEDEEGWNDFFDTYWRLIYNVARRARMSDAEAMDVVQMTMISVSGEIGGFVYNRREGSFRAWLGTLTRRRVADFFRAQCRQQLRRKGDGLDEAESVDGESMAPGEIEELVDPNESELEKIWNDEWEENLIQTALGRLRPDVSQLHYQVFHCHVMQGWGVVKVCRELGVNPGTVYLVKHRVGGIFKRELEILERDE